MAAAKRTKATKQVTEESEPLEAKPTKARQILKPTQDNMVPAEDLFDEEEKPKEIRSRRGARQLKENKPKGAARFLFEKEAKFKTDRPISIYIERITDVDTGNTSNYIWWHAENSKTYGRTEISRINPRTGEEFRLGYDFEIPLTKKVVEELLSKSFVKTKWIRKDGPTRIKIDDPQTILDALTKKD